MTTQALNRVTLIGYLDSDPQTLGRNTTHEQITFNVVTQDYCKDSAGERYLKHRQHKVVVMDYIARQYIHMFLHKGDCVFVEGQLEYVRVSSGNSSKLVTAEITIMPSQGYLRRLGENTVTELNLTPVKADNRCQLSEANRII